MSNADSRFEIQPLSRVHNREDFHSGEQDLDNWLKVYASQSQRRGIATTFVVTRADEDMVLGYYSSVATSVQAIESDQLGSLGTGRYSIPVVLIARLAVDSRHQGKSLGSRLLVHALKGAVEVSERVGVQAVIVDSLTAAAGDYYLKWGFLPFSDDPTRFFMPIATIRKTVLS